MWHGNKNDKNRRQKQNALNLLLYRVVEWHSSCRATNHKTLRIHRKVTVCEMRFAEQIEPSSLLERISQEKEHDDKSGTYSSTRGCSQATTQARIDRRSQVSSRFGILCRNNYGAWGIMKQTLMPLGSLPTGRGHPSNAGVLSGIPRSLMIETGPCAKVRQIR